MSKIIHTQKHMTLSDRIFIEQSLSSRDTFKQIALILKKDPSTVSKEIRKHRIPKKGSHYSIKNDCKFLNSCNEFRICTHKVCQPLCKRSKTCDCTKHCSKYQSFVCPKLTKPPYVCNACSKYSCRHDKFYYRAKDADASYQQLKRESRTGINLSSEERAHLDALVSPLVLNGQTMNHIFTNHAGEIPCSERTLYRYIDDGILNVRNIDLIRKVKYKPRKQDKQRTSLERACLVNRTYEDFLSYLSENSDTNIVEMDTVVGPDPGKVLLTMLFRNCSLMIAFLMNNNRSDSVIQIFRFLQSSLGSDRFARLFPVILVDRGSEFSNPWALECDEYGEILSRLFYCNANAPYQKGRLEKNHEFIRYILPKGTSFDALHQADVTKVINHINSTTRASLNGQTPFKLATLLLDSKLFDVLNLELVEPDKVLLKPALLKR